MIYKRARGWMNWPAPGIVLLMGLVFTPFGGVPLHMHRYQRAKQNDIELEI